MRHERYACAFKHEVAQDGKTADREAPLDRNVLDGAVGRLDRPGRCWVIGPECEALKRLQIRGRVQLLCAKIVRARHQPTPKCADPVRHQPVVLEGADANSQVDAGILHVFKGIAGAHHQRNSRMAGEELGKESLGDQSDDFRGCRDGHLTRDLGGFLTSKLGKQVNFTAEELAGLRQPLARGCDTHASTSLLEQFDTQPLFEQGDVPTDAGLGHAQMFCRGSNAPQAEHRMEASERQKAYGSINLNHWFEVISLFYFIGKT